MTAAIARDGGGSLVADLKEPAYCHHPDDDDDEICGHIASAAGYSAPKKRIDSLLKQCPGRPKLLRFLEEHPDVFVVDRQAVPHFVRLVHVPPYNHKNQPDNETNNSDIQSNSLSLKALHQKIHQVLRRYQRQRQRRPDLARGVSLAWLLQRCTRPLHAYLRATDTYRRCIYNDHNYIDHSTTISPRVAPVGTDAWYQAVHETFVDVVKTVAIVQDGQAWLAENDIDDYENDEQHNINDKGTRHHNTALIKAIAAAVHADGATHVTGSLLLHRRPDLVKLLEGQSLADALETFGHERLRQEFAMNVQTLPDNHLVLQSTQSIPQGRLQVDETGLFSVAASKWAKAMANRLYRQAHIASSSSNLMDSTTSVQPSNIVDTPPLLAVDLCASVGGTTLALAKYFPRVWAVEVDAHRAGLLQRNLATFDLSEAVTVECADAVDVIPRIRAACHNSNEMVVIMLDPPWGGKHYKAIYNPQHLYMGQWSLSHIVHLIALHAAPTVIGLRVPLKFNVDFFVNEMIQGSDIHIISVRRLGPQQFAVLQCDRKSGGKALPVVEAGTDNSVDAIVRQVWRTSPGMGIRDLQLRVQEVLQTSVPKARIKAAKALIPYRYTGHVQVEKRSDNEINRSSAAPKHERHDFIVQKIQERQSLRNTRRYDEADYIQRGLEAMGVEIDDVRKTWKMGPAILHIPQQTANDNLQSTRPSSLDDDAGVSCQMCGHCFASRNLVFKHLRDPASGCGTLIFAQGLTLPPAPSKASHNSKANHKRAPPQPGQTASHAPASHCVWVGDLPLAWTRRQRWVRALVNAHVPPGIPTPWIKTVVRKAYRQRMNDQCDDNDNKTGAPYLGFAIVVFRDACEAAAARLSLDGVDASIENTFWGDVPSQVYCDALPPFVIKARPVERGESTPATTAWAQDNNPEHPCGSRDPPLREQLRPLSLVELRHRIALFDREKQWQQDENHTLNNPQADSSNYLTRHQEALDKLLHRMQQEPPRKHSFREGCPIPDSISSKLLTILQEMKWPARNERPGLTSERYFVLLTTGKDRFYQDLRQACRNLMDWADPSYYYSGIAVTHNFVASPHIDFKDRNYQYAVALGDFEQGGQLCVESEQGKSVEIIDTKHRIAKLDGRNVHWVRTWKRGDRYSLIFYDTTDRTQLEVETEVSMG